MPALRKAFDISSSDDVSGSHVIKPVAFRNFLGNVFFYNKIFLAFDLIDTDKVSLDRLSILPLIAQLILLCRIITSAVKNGTMVMVEGSFKNF